MLRIGLLLLGFLAAMPGLASDSELERVLARDAAPEGVVFEIVTGDEDGLEWALPRVKRAIERLRARFPDVPVAVVTHGEEMFALESAVRDSYPKVHETVRDLLADDVTVHACGTFAGWRGLAEEHFPDHVDLSASGPAQINDYRALGYILITLTGEDQRND